MTSEPPDASNKEALEYWGYLLKPDKCGVELFNRLLTGIANFICTHFEPTDCPDLTPSQLAAFYRAVGGQYDVLFEETPPSSIAFIYKSLGCLHSLQPTPKNEGYDSPSIPALKKQGFITWQTIQLLLCPDEHVPFLQKSVLEFDILDPATGNPFPKLLPKESFPEKPDPAMVQWYEGVADRLRREAEVEELKGDTAKVDVDIDEPRAPSDSSSDNSADERHGAEAYFRDPLYRNRRTRPTIIRTYSRQPPRAPRQFVEDRGRRVANSVRHFWNPFDRRRSLPDRDHDGEVPAVLDDDVTPTASGAQSQPRYAPKRPQVQRRESSLSSTDSESDVANRSGHPESPVLRHRRSHEPPSSPREYFPLYVEQPRRYSHDARHTESPGYGPTKTPIFATHVANLQAHKYYDRRTAAPARPSYPRHNVRYSHNEASPIKEDPPIIREPYEYSSRGSRRQSRERDRDRERDRERDRRMHRYVTPVDGVGGRRYPVEAPWR